MKIWQLLRSLESLSDTMASLYDCLRLHFALDADASVLFAGIRNEKLARRDLVRRERQHLFQTLENYLEARDYDQGLLDRTLRAVEDLMARAGRLTLEEAVRSALALEREATARHSLRAVGRATPSLGALARNLGAVGPDHAARLASFASRRGITTGA